MIKHRYIIITGFIMFSFLGLFAQKKKVVLTWSIAGAVPAANGQARALGVAGPVTGVHGHVLFVAGGANFPDAMPWQGGKKKYYDEIVLFKSKDNNLVVSGTGLKLPEPLAYAATCSTPAGVICAGGENEQGIRASVYLLKWIEAAQSAEIEILPQLPFAVTNAAATSFNNKVYVAGGETQNGVSDQCIVLDLHDTAKGWTAVPSLPKPVSHTLLLALPSKKGVTLYVAGGRRKMPDGVSELYNTMYEFTGEHNQWKEITPLPYALSAGTGVALEDGSLLLFGGDKGTTFTQVEKTLAAISQTSDPSEKEKLIQKKNQLLETHPGFSNEILRYDVKTGICERAGHIPYHTPVTTTASWWNKKVIIPSGEIKAGVRTPVILSLKVRYKNR